MTHVPCFSDVFWIFVCQSFPNNCVQVSREEMVLPWKDFSPRKLFVSDKIQQSSYSLFLLLFFAAHQ